MIIVPQPGDVWSVNTGNSTAAKLIRFGEWLHRAPSMANHVVGVHHSIRTGWSGIAGKPGGVGWEDLTRYTKNKNTVSNQDQPKTPEQRQAICDSGVHMLGVSYDNDAILADAMIDLGLTALYSDWKGQGWPAHVVCSSLWAYIYGKVGLAHPAVGHERFCQPSDWTRFSLTKAWLK